jgi:hypothetical protein
MTCNAGTSTGSAMTSVSFCPVLPLRPITNCTTRIAAISATVTSLSRLPGVVICDVSTFTPSVFIVRNTCSMVQRIWYQAALGLDPRVCFGSSGAFTVCVVSRHQWTRCFGSSGGSTSRTSTTRIVRLAGRSLPAQADRLKVTSPKRTATRAVRSARWPLPYFPRFAATLIR